MNDYEPGDVATATVRGVKGVRVLRSDDKTWLSARRIAGYIEHGGDSHVTDIVPLRVVDADAVVLNLWAFMEPVSDLIRDLRECSWREVADQIEAQTKAPGPDEPTEFGAKVRDAKGQMWLRIFSAKVIPLGGVAWRNEWDRAVTWSQLDVAEVLS